MIRRRQFLSSLAICATAPATLPCLAGNLATGPYERLNWTSDLISMESHRTGGRAPVVTDVSLQPGGEQLAVVGDDHFICIYDFRAGQFVQNLERHSDWVRCSGYSPNGNVLATGGNDRRLIFWDTEDFSAAPVVRKHPHAIIGIDFSADNRRLAAVGFAPVLQLYDLPSRTLKREIPCPTNDNHAVGFSADSRWVAVGGRTGSIQVWEVESGQRVASYRPHRRRIRSLMFDPRGKIISCADDQVVAITDPLDPQNSHNFPRQAAKIYDVTSLDGGLLATAGTDNRVHLWRLNDRQHIGFLKGHTGTVSCLDSNRSKIVSGSFDTQVRVWQIKKDFVASLPHPDPLTGGRGEIK
ncbi:MAG: WD40 repeat domain-containing protein [Mariniblastus sp.]|nr:WD40 repeat domain-containing protein [Mariniblastus sp.]